MDERIRNSIRKYSGLLIYLLIMSVSTVYWFIFEPLESSLIEWTILVFVSLIFIEINGFKIKETESYIP